MFRPLLNPVMAPKLEKLSEAGKGSNLNAIELCDCRVVSSKATGEPCTGGIETGEIKNSSHEYKPLTDGSSDCPCVAVGVIQLEVASFAIQFPLSGKEPLAVT